MWRNLAKKKVVFLLIVICVFMLSMMPMRDLDSSFHSIAEWHRFQSLEGIHGPIDSTLMFPHSNSCNGCHGYDPQGRAMHYGEGIDVNIHDDWSTSMMANAAKDPFWQAKVSHEVLANPQHKLALESKCTSCHAPQGHFTAILRGASHYTIDQMRSDTIAMDGVSCGSCHMKSKSGLESLFSGEARYDTNRVMYGPYDMPFAAPMESFVGFNPIFSEHINDAGICASCHTLLTDAVDNEGNFTGVKFVEQATYHEWLNSDYNDGQSLATTCQGCHMPRIDEDIVISANYLFLQGRSPFGQHDLIGANSTMIKLMKANKKLLGISAADSHFDETINKTVAMLQQQTLDMSMELVGADLDSLYVDVSLVNKAGHKFPSGYPSRRVFVELSVVNEEGNTIFHSGRIDADHEIIGQSESIESHHDIIRHENQVQIYEFVTGDVHGAFTTILERANTVIKDNRIPPKGFTTSHPVYDTTLIVGKAIYDPDFNKDENGQGMGGDIVHYHIPIGGNSGLLKVYAKVYYQALPPRWLAPMFSENTPEIDVFRSMYDNADLTPVLVAMDTISHLMSSDNDMVRSNELAIFPNPSIDGEVFFEFETKPYFIAVYDVNGVLISRQRANQQSIKLPDETGMYLIVFEYGGSNVLKKVWRW